MFLWQPKPGILNQLPYFPLQQSVKNKRTKLMLSYLWQMNKFYFKMGAENIAPHPWSNFSEETLHQKEGESSSIWYCVGKWQNQELPQEPLKEHEIDLLHPSFQLTAPHNCEVHKKLYRPWKDNYIKKTRGHSKLDQLQSETYGAISMELRNHSTLKVLTSWMYNVILFLHEWSITDRSFEFGYRL